MKESYELIPFSGEALFGVLTNDRCLRRPTEDAMTYLSNYLDELDCTAMLVENKYIDRDFLDDFSHYYVRCFADYNRFCRRIHLFRKFDEDLLKRYLEGAAGLKEISDHCNGDPKNPNYLGFIVAKPLPSAIIGRTALRPWDETTSGGEDVPGNRSIRCIREYRANFAGIDLRVQGLGFQEQDTVLSRCATSALWSAFQKTSDLFDHGQASLFEITTRATRYHSVSRTIPSEGLTISQMCQAIREAGLEAELKELWGEVNPERGQPTYKYPLLNAAYGYLRAGIPVVLAALVKGRAEHAVTLVGYRIADEGPGFDEMELWQPGLGLKLKGSRIVSLYAHDDQIGPYSKLVVRRMHTGPFPIELESSWRLESGDPTNLVPLAMISPVYHKIRVPFISTVQIAGLTEWLLRPTLDGHPQLEWDIFLTSVNDYKREIAARTDIVSSIRKGILSLSHPRFLWRARAFSGKSEVCEMLIDATDLEWSFQLYCMMVFDAVVRARIKTVCEETRPTLEKYPLALSLADWILAQPDGEVAWTGLSRWK